MGGRRGGRRRDQARSRLGRGAVRAIGVGNGPAAIAVGYGGVWVANRDDGTVTRIDAATDAVTDTVRVGGSPGAVAAGLGAIWVADGGTGAVIRIDPRTRRVTRRIAVGSAPSALALAGGSVWVAATASRASHRGGTLRFESGPSGGCYCLDPAGYDGSDWSVLSLAYDGLVAYRRVPGAGGSTLVADLAASVPQPTDGGRTYTFQLRRGLRFSDGTPVRPEDFRASIERLVRLAGQVAPLYAGIVGADACSPRRCDLSNGIETDAAARTITIHLRRPDAEFEHKLATPLAYVLPARAPATLIRGRPPPGTGPYRIAAFAPARGARLVRNPRFRSWSTEARPDGFPDAITVTPSKDAAAQVAAVQHGRADAVVAAGLSTVQLPARPGARASSRRRQPPLHGAHAIHPLPLPQRARAPLRRPAGAPGAELRDRSPAHGRARGRQRPCGPVLPGDPTRAARLRAHVSLHSRRRRPRARGWRRISRALAGWSRRPARAERACRCGDGRPTGASSATPAVSCADLGYRVRIRVVPDVTRYFDYVNDTRHHVQVGFYGWIADFLTPVDLLRSVHLRSSGAQLQR